MKRFVCLLLCVLMTGSFLTACSEKQTGTQNNAPPPPPAKLSIGFSVTRFVVDFKENALTRYLEKEANCELEFVPAFSDPSVMCVFPGSEPFSGCEDLDIVWGVSFGKETINIYGREGVLLNLAPYLANRNGAAKVFWDRLEENYTPFEIENIKRKMIDPDSGGIYFIPTLGTSLTETMDYQAWINTTWLDALGLPMPTDPESLYNTLVAFKKQDPNGNGKGDEIPIYGSERGGDGADVINFLINMFLYFDDRKHFSVDENGELYAPFISNKYREALQYINRLYAEKLMPDAVFTTSIGDLAKVNSPQDTNGIVSEPLVGVFCGDLKLHFHLDNTLLEQYEPLPYLEEQSVVFNDDWFSPNIYIMAGSEDPDAAFRLIMKMFEEETSYRVRYGEYGVNWEYASEGAVSEYGLPAKIKVIEDPLELENKCLWSSTYEGTFLEYLRGEDVIWPEEINEWQRTRNEKSLQARKNADAAAAANNPDKLCPTLTYTEEEQDRISELSNQIKDYYIKSRTDFIKNKMDPNTEDWDRYVKQVKDYGLDVWLTAAQAAYDRVPNI